MFLGGEQTNLTLIMCKAQKYEEHINIYEVYLWY